MQTNRPLVETRGGGGMPPCAGPETRTGDGQKGRKTQTTRKPKTAADNREDGVERDEVGGHAPTTTGDRGTAREDKERAQGGYKGG